MLTIFNCITI